MLKSKSTVVVLLIAVVGAAAVTLLQDDMRISLAASVESHGSRVLGTRVDVEGATIDLDAGTVSVTNLEVANPGGFSDQNMITIASVSARGDLAGGVIEELVFEGIDALIEFRGAQSNFEVVGERATDNAGGSAEVDEKGAVPETNAGEDPDGGSTTPDTWRIDTAGFENIRVRVQADWTDEQVTFDAGGLSVQDLDGRLDDLTARLIAGFLGNVMSAGAGQVKDSRLRESLAERAGALQERMRRAGERSGDDRDRAVGGSD